MTDAQTQTATGAILYERRGSTAWIMLNRPDTFNAINNEVREGLSRLLLQAQSDPQTAVVVITGAGEKAFCAGADIKEFGTEPDPSTFRASRRDTHWTKLINQVTKPIIAAVNGYCLGGGLELAIACDIRIASENAQFALPEVTRATLPGAGGTQRLSRLIGVGRAMDMILTGERIDAAEALRIGLVTRLVPAAALIEATTNLANRISENAPLSVTYAKEAVTRGFDMPLDQGLNLELDFLALLMPTEDRKEASAAFREKRKPMFKGR